MTEEDKLDAHQRGRSVTKSGAGQGRGLLGAFGRNRRTKGVIVK